MEACSTELLFFNPSPLLAVFLLSVFYCTGTIGWRYASSRFTVWHWVTDCSAVVTLVFPVVVKYFAYDEYFFRTYYFLFARRHFVHLFCPFSLVPGMHQRVYNCACAVWFGCSASPLQGHIHTCLTYFSVCWNLVSECIGFRLCSKRLTSFLVLALRETVGEWRVTSKRRVCGLSWLKYDLTLE